MPQPLIFRSFVLLSLIFEFAAEGVDLVFTDLISPELASAIEKEPMSGVIEIHPFISLAILVPYFVAAFAGAVGIFLFEHWGRALSLYSTVLGCFIFPFLGSIASSGLSYALGEAAYSLWGAALALAYLSRMSERFKLKIANMSAKRDAPLTSTLIERTLEVCSIITTLFARLPAETAPTPVPVPYHAGFLS
jgi:hypothetical protein